MIGSFIASPSRCSHRAQCRSPETTFSSGKPHAQRQTGFVFGNHDFTGQSGLPAAVRVSRWADPLGDGKGRALGIGGGFGVSRPAFLFETPRGGHGQPSTRKCSARPRKECNARTWPAATTPPPPSASNLSRPNEFERQLIRRLCRCRFCAFALQSIRILARGEDLPEPSLSGPARPAAAKPPEGRR